MKVAVLGAGTMGHGIAQVSASAGNRVTLRDIEDDLIEDGIRSITENLEKAVELDKMDESEMNETLDRINGESDLETAVEDAELVIEAIPERLDLKQETFVDLEDYTTPDTILATNTSSLSVTEITSVLEKPDRAVGMHFFNPVHIMELVEVIAGAHTSESTLSTSKSFVEDIDKKPITIVDTPGFATSRLGVALGVEAIRMVEQGVASPADIDSAMELGYNHPMGPLELTDVVGLDVRLDILEYLHDELGERFRPPQLLRRKVRAGKHGKKTGEGFYTWESGEITGVSSEVIDA
jgi:3-hydroxybutyryl-CoA dehydrogenase